MAAAIEKRFGVRPKLVPGKQSGVFDVEVDGRLIFSKFQKGRFPEHEEVLDAIGSA